jgi:hypothetical protein
MSPPPGNRFEIGSLDSCSANFYRSGRVSSLGTMYRHCGGYRYSQLRFSPPHEKTSPHCYVGEGRGVACRSQIPSWLCPDIQWVFNLDCTADIPDTVAGAKMKLTFQEAKM